MEVSVFELSERWHPCSIYPLRQALYAVFYTARLAHCIWTLSCMTWKISSRC